MKKPDPDSFNGKIWLMVIDKLILGSVIGAAYFLFTYFQSQQQFNQTKQLQDAQTNFERLALAKEYMPIIMDPKNSILERGYALRSAIMTGTIDKKTGVDLLFNLNSLPLPDLENISLACIPGGAGEILSKCDVPADSHQIHRNQFVGLVIENATHMLPFDSCKIFNDQHFVLDWIEDLYYSCVNIPWGVIYSDTNFLAMREANLLGRALPLDTSDYPFDVTQHALNMLADSLRPHGNPDYFDRFSTMVADIIASDILVLRTKLFINQALANSLLYLRKLHPDDNYISTCIVELQRIPENQKYIGKLDKGTLLQ